MHRSMKMVVIAAAMAPLVGTAGLGQEPAKKAEAAMDAPRQVPPARGPSPARAAPPPPAAGP